MNPLFYSHFMQIDKVTYRIKNRNRSICGIKIMFFITNNWFPDKSRKKFDNKNYQLCKYYLSKFMPHISI